MKKHIGPAFIKRGSKKISAEDLEEILKRKKEVRARFESKGPLRKFLEDVKLLLSLLSDYFRKRYTIVPWWGISAAVFSLAYVICPIDLVPDAIPFVGQIDDATVLAVCLSMIDQDLQAYKEWKVATA